MKALSDYKRRARELAKTDSQSGFQYHCIRNASSRAIDALTGLMARKGFQNDDRQAVELEWQNSLRPVATFNGWGQL
jgi:GGDEF domain-containing protein